MGAKGQGKEHTHMHQHQENVIFASLSYCTRYERGHLLLLLLYIQVIILSKKAMEHKKDIPTSLTAINPPNNEALVLKETN